MQDKKQIIGLILSVVLSVGLVFAGVNAATTVGTDVSVAGDLAVTATTTLSGDLTVANNIVASDDLTVTATTTLNGDIILGNAAGDNITIGGTIASFTAATGSIADLTVTGDLAVTATTTLSGDLTVANNIVASDDLAVTGYTTTTGGLSIGGGPIVSYLYSTSTVLNFGAIAALNCATSSTSLSGVVAGDVVTLGMAQEIAGATSTVSWNAWVPAADTVYVRVCNVGSSNATPDFDPGTVRIDVWQH